MLFIYQRKQWKAQISFFKLNSQNQNLYHRLEANTPADKFPKLVYYHSCERKQMNFSIFRSEFPVLKRRSENKQNRFVNKATRYFNHAINYMTMSLVLI